MGGTDTCWRLAELDLGNGKGQVGGLFFDEQTKPPLRDRSDLIANQISSYNSCG
jgi:hypothetical protein